MNEYIAFDSHKEYTLVEREDVQTGKARQHRIEHRRGAIVGYLRGCRNGTAVAVEATGNWCWIVEEIERAGLAPQLVQPRKGDSARGGWKLVGPRVSSARHIVFLMAELAIPRSLFRAILERIRRLRLAEAVPR